MLGGSFFLGITAYGALFVSSPFIGMTTFWGVLGAGFIAGMFVFGWGNCITSFEKRRIEIVLGFYQNQILALNVLLLARKSFKISFWYYKNI